MSLQELFFLPVAQTRNRRTQKAKGNPLSYLFIATSVVQDPATSTAYYTSIAGRNGSPPMRCGIEPKASLTRAYVLAVNEGLRDLGEWFGRYSDYSVDVLVPNAEIAELIQNRKSGKSFLHGDDDDVWAEHIKLREGYRLNLVTNHSQSQHLMTFWGWHSNPTQAGELPDGETGYNPFRKRTD